ncbi:MAG TPA: YbjN domain-containing protein [Acidimicrobiales bacterium]|jgi:hypothetical protein|nr:YbjN domain-containing protein [Acidimicrobiales bacterium]
MSDPAAARRAFLEAQIGHLDTLGFVIVGLPQPPFDAIQARREDDTSYVVEIAGRDPAAPFDESQEQALATLSFENTGETWAAPAVEGAAAAVDLVERVLTEVLAVAPETPVDIRHGTLRDERAAAAKLEAMRAFIEPVLEEINGGEVAKDPDGDYILDLLGMRVFVAPRAAPGRPPIIRVFAITNADLNLTPELGLLLARVNFSLAFGRFSIDTDHRSVWFDETLLGDQVTRDELSFVITVVASTASEWDEKIAAMFGGTFRGARPATPAVEAAPTKPGQGGYL